MDAEARFDAFFLSFPPEKQDRLLVALEEILKKLTQENALLEKQGRSQENWGIVPLDQERMPAGEA
jgi:hypothetical protein